MKPKAISKSRAAKLAKSLNRRNQNGESWRALETAFHVPAGTLCRIAKSGGEWLPKNEDELGRLGLIVPHSPYSVMPRWWKRTPEALAAFLHIRGQAKEIADDTRKAQKGK